MRARASRRGWMEAGGKESNGETQAPGMPSPAPRLVFLKLDLRRRDCFRPPTGPTGSYSLEAASHDPCAPSPSWAGTLSALGSEGEGGLRKGTQSPFPPLCWCLSAPTPLGTPSSTPPLSGQLPPQAPPGVVNEAAWTSKSWRNNHLLCGAAAVGGKGALSPLPHSPLACVSLTSAWWTSSS